MAAVMKKSKMHSKPQDDKSVPYVTNLHEDPQLSGKNYFPFKDGKLTIGRRQKDVPAQPDIILAAYGI